jgi:hypothetical protein
MQALPWKDFLPKNFRGHAACTAPRLRHYKNMEKAEFDAGDSRLLCRHWL